ncbi:MAG: DUF4105 domain-containing protein [Longimicrobiales bacterium]|nr:DUF4105 domain-containing protein [Longimicrobiales bacterium]
MPRLRTAALLTGLALSGGSLSAQPAPDSVAGPEPGSELHVWLVTMAPGDAVWERFGHNALRVLDTSTGRDVAYNWGIFDFDQVDFIPRFLKGQMLYMMAGFRTEPFITAYARVGRQVVLQELALTPAQRVALRDFAEWNALPENREYRYDYFLDNCSTRIRDLVDRVLGGALARRFEAEGTGTSYRWQNRRLTRMDPFLYTGMDVLLGSPGDRPISVWEEMFLPMTLRDALRDMTVVDEAGVERPVVLEETIAVPGNRPPDPEGPPAWLRWYLLLGVALGGVLAWCGRRAAGGSRWGRILVGSLSAAWSLAAGFVGTLLVLVLFTEHRFMFWNENLFLLNPLSLALVVLVPLAMHQHGQGRPGRAAWAAEWLALAVAFLGVVGLAAELLPATVQDNAIFLALVLPPHVGLWWALRRARGAVRSGTS